MLAFSPPPTKRRRRSWESHKWRFPIWVPAVRSGESAKRSAGSAELRNGASVAKGASACSSGGTDSVAASINKGDGGMHRWVGLGVIADNLINIGRVLTER